MVGLAKKFALIFVDHTRKASVQDVDVFSTLYGTQAKQALAMTLMMVSKEGDEVRLETKGRGIGEHKYLFMCTQQDHGSDYLGFRGADQGILSGSRQKVVLQAFANARSDGVYELGPKDMMDYAELEQTPVPTTISARRCFKCAANRFLSASKVGCSRLLTPAAYLTRSQHMTTQG